jgi:chromosomal replication initiation ATPase DnaA
VGGIFFAITNENEMDKLVENIFKSVCQQIGITPELLFSKKRSAIIVDAKQACAFALREWGFTLKDIAKELNYKDHTTIVHLLNKRHHNSLKNQLIGVRAINWHLSMRLMEMCGIETNMEAKNSDED